MTSSTTATSMGWTSVSTMATSTASTTSSSRFWCSWGGYKESSKKQTRENHLKKSDSGSEQIGVFDLRVVYMNYFSPFLNRYFLFGGACIALHIIGSLLSTTIWVAKSYKPRQNVCLAIAHYKREDYAKCLWQRVASSKVHYMVVSFVIGYCTLFMEFDWLKQSDFIFLNSLP